MMTDPSRSEKRIGKSVMILGWDWNDVKLFVCTNYGVAWEGVLVLMVDIPTWVLIILLWISNLAVT